MARVKLALVLVLALVAVILILQNTAPVETRILFATVTMPRAVLLLVTTLIGFALGVIVTFLVGRRKSSPLTKDL